MALQIWLPGTKDIRNQGLIYSEPTGGYEIVNDAAFGKVIRTTSAQTITTGIKSVDGWDVSSGSCGFGAWLKFKLNEMRYSSAYTYNSTNNVIHNGVLGFNNYGGISLDLTSNNIYNDGAFNSATLQAHLRYNTTASSAAKAIEFDKWHHWYVQYSKERGKLELYYDGALTSSAVTTGLTITALDKNFTINNATVWGGNAPGKFLTYYVSDIRVYNNELSPEEIKDLATHKLFSVRGQGMVEGSSVVNYLSHANTETSNGWGSFGFGGKGAIALVNNVEPFYPGNVIEISGNGGDGSYSAEGARTCTATSVNNGEKVTFSFYAKGVGSTVGKNVRAHIYNKSGSTTMSTGTSNKLTDDWVRYSHTLKWTGTTLSAPTYSCYIVGGSFTQGEKLYACNFQFEIGGEPHPYQMTQSISTCVNDEGGTGLLMVPDNVAKSGSTLYFNGTSAKITMQDLDYMRIVDNSYTMSMWLNSQEADSSRSIYWGSGGQGNGYTLNIEKQANTNKLRVYNNNAPDWVVDGCVIPANQWVHVIITKSGGTVTVYKNGASVGTKTGFSNHSAYDKIYWLGSDSRTGDVMYKGYMGDVHFYGTCFTSADALALYNKEKSRYQ